MSTQAQVGSTTIDQLIINSPYEEPHEHWRYHRETRLFTREPERRKAGYVRASEKSHSFDDPGIFIELPLVNQIRPRVKAWREADYHGASGITKRLLQHWRDPEQRDSNRRFFFCQLEAIETLVWLTEAPASERVGIEIPSDGGPFARLCCKMATGSGKTILMGMLIAWQVLNKVTYPQDKRFSKNILLIAPGLTVKSRLQVLVPGTSGNYYTEFQIIPPGRAKTILVNPGDSYLPAHFRRSRFWLGFTKSLTAFVVKIQGPVPHLPISLSGSWQRSCTSELAYTAY